MWGWDTQTRYDNALESLPGPKWAGPGQSRRILGGSKKEQTSRVPTPGTNRLLIQASE